MKVPKFNLKTLNIFTDASITQLATGELVGCSGAVAYTGVEGELTLLDEEFCINRNTTNNESELKAIYLGICLALKYKEKYEIINLFSDSKICIFGLRQWVFDWVERSTGDVLIGTTNKKVSNQSEILECIYTIIENNLNINLYHQKGHIEHYNRMKKAISTFKQNNLKEELYITNEFIVQICKCNCYIDQKTREILSSKRILSISPELKTKEYKYVPFDCEKYRELVTC